jgi:hypothetical protein
MSNAHFKERGMSLKAKGLLSLMLSLPEEWDFSELGLSKLSKDGKDSTAKALDELEQFGYLRRTQSKGEDGKFAGYEYDIFETPQTETPQAEKPYTENPLTVNPFTENPQQLNTNSNNTTIQSKVSGNMLHSDSTLHSEDKKKKEIKKKENFGAKSAEEWFVSAISEAGFGEALTEALCEWVRYKTERRQAYKPRGLKSLLTIQKREAEKRGEQFVVDSIYASMAANYQGIFPPKSTANTSDNTRFYMESAGGDYPF